jgi:hypothetical protein
MILNHEKGYPNLTTIGKFTVIAPTFSPDKDFVITELKRYDFNGSNF